MPTKERNKRNRELAWMNPVPEYARATPDSDTLGSFGLAGTNFMGSIKEDKDGVAHLHQNFGKGGNDMRAAERLDRTAELKRKYRDLWGKRGVAKQIGFYEGLTDQTIRGYFKDFP